jgi:two-component system LytT family sensor kinase
MNNRSRTIIIIFLSALLVSVLFNIRVFISLYEALSSAEMVEVVKERYRAGIKSRLQFAWFNLIIEFVVYTIVAFFNYSWFDIILNKVRITRWHIPLIVSGNIALYFILIPPGKLFHSAYFASMESMYRKEIDFDIQNFLIINISVFLLAILVASLLKIMKKMRIAEEENIKLAEEKNRAELSALKEQISPHFFFNTLSSLSSVVRSQEKEAALDYIGKISDTYRYTLSIKEDLVTVKEEMEFLDSYLYLLQERFGPKLMVENTVTKEYYDSVIPPMSLQLLVENAIQHNMITASSPLKIRMYTESGMICIENNLQEKESAESFGLGLKNLSDRYRLLSSRDIIILKEKSKFIVKLPLL